MGEAGVGRTLARLTAWLAAAAFHGRIDFCDRFFQFRRRFRETLLAELILTVLNPRARFLIALRLAMALRGRPTSARHSAVWEVRALFCAIEQRRQFGSRRSALLRRSTVAAASFAAIAHDRGCRARSSGRDGNRGRHGVMRALQRLTAAWYSSSRSDRRPPREQQRWHLAPDSFPGLGGGAAESRRHKKQSRRAIRTTTTRHRWYTCRTCNEPRAARFARLRRGHAEFD